MSEEAPAAEWAAGARSPQRRCIVTGEVKDKSELLRFVIGPENVVVPDIRATLPGRGIWVTPTREAVTIAVKKKLFARAAKANVKAHDMLPEQVERLLRARLLSALGLARRQGILVTGFEKTRALLKQKQASVWIEAADGAEDGRRKLAPLATGVPCLAFFTREELAEALGREEVVHAALEKAPSARNVMDAMLRLTGFIGESAL